MHSLLFFIYKTIQTTKNATLLDILQIYTYNFKTQSKTYIQKRIHIKNTKCSSCGAYIASRLQECPYCKTQQSNPLKLSTDLKKKLYQQLDIINDKVYEGPFLYLFSYVFYILPFFIPCVLSVVMYMLTQSIVITILFSITSILISIIVFYTLHEFMRYSDYIEKWLWEFRYKKKMRKLFISLGLAPDLYFDILLEYLMQKENPTYPNLSATIHE